MITRLEQLPHRKLILMLVLLFIPLFLFYLGVPSLWDEDETIYAEISRQMVVRHDLVDTVFNDAPRFDKPPLNFWINVFFYKIFGTTEFSSRLGSTCFGFFGLILLFLIGQRLFNKRSAILAVLALGTAFLYFIETQLALIDTTLTFCITLTLYWFYRGYFEKERRFLWLMGIPLGLGILAKGPVALVLCGGVALLVWGFQTLKHRQKISDLFNWQLLLGFLLALAISLPWYLAIWSRHGAEFLQSHFGFHMLQRFTSPLENHGGAWYYHFYYLILLVIGFLPWSANLPAALWQAGKRSGEPKNLFLLAWIGLPFLFFSLAQTKLPGYLLPLFPPLALLIGSWWDRLLESRRPRPGLWWGMAFQLLIALGFALLFFTQRNRLPAGYQQSAAVLFLMPLSLVVGAVLGTIRYWKSKDYADKFSTTFATFYLFWALFLLLLVPIVETYKPVKNLAAALQPYLGKQDRVVSFIRGSLGAPFYTAHPVVFVKSQEALVAELSRRPQRVFALVEERAITYLKENQIPFYQLARSGSGFLIANQPVE